MFSVRDESAPDTSLSCNHCSAHCTLANLYTAQVHTAHLHTCTIRCTFRSFLKLLIIAGTSPTFQVLKMLTIWPYLGSWCCEIKFDLSSFCAYWLLVNKWTWTKRTGLVSEKLYQMHSIDHDGGWLRWTRWSLVFGVEEDGGGEKDHLGSHLQCIKTPPSPSSSPLH